jgi:hypothetical protein
VGLYPAHVTEGWLEVSVGMTYPKDVRTAVVGAYYPRAIAVADGARAKAQSAYTIASAIAAALVAAGILTDLGERAWYVQLAALAALAAWLLTAVLFMQAVAEPVNLSLPSLIPTADGFIDAVLAAARKEREAIEHRVVIATFATVGAVILTVLAFVLVVAIPITTSVHGTVLLTEEGVSTIEKTCNRPVATIAGELDPGALTDRYVPIELDAGTCADDSVVVRLPQRFVLAVRDSQVQQTPSPSPSSST